MTERDEFVKYILIAAGGYGSRMNTAVPKQFLTLCGKPIIVHTLHRFHRIWPDAVFVVAIAEEHLAQWKKLRRKYCSGLNISEVKGGATRFHSIKNGLKRVKDDGIAIIHDACRPLFSRTLLLKCLAAAVKSGSAVPAVDLQDSIREIMASGSRHRPRMRYKLVQTPQCFRAPLIKAAYRQTFQKEFTDDASVLEAHGGTVHLVEGDPINIKITTPLDLLVAEKLLAAFPDP
ncbi:MAG: 2-C-methyl-D-erythritol 4-phosphate cytidylyltransferase [Chitinophagales bacterium]|nr:2-C-methyl-D-erythritol 4-phosphate cytidylyltransferase [Chitinophagales bacterium]MDW8392664.1 2-C-methyl-D-erythritol 4-phosphate cytidylyltransferase [Chitinophagales bacterium]